MFRVLRSTCLVVGVAQATLAIAGSAVPVQAAQDPAVACRTYTRGGISDALFWPTFEQVIEGSTVIVEATVTDVAPSNANRMPAGLPPDTDVTVIASRVLKGPAPGGPFVVSQHAEINTFEMGPGQRFLLLMTPLPDGKGYRADPFARLCIDGDRIRVARDPYGTRFDNRLVADVVGDILGHLNLPRIRGRVSFEAGPFPSAHTLVLPPSDREHRGRLRILLTRSSEGTATQARTTAVMLMTQAPRTLDPRIAAFIGLDAPAPGEPVARLFAMDATGTFELPLAPGTYQLAIEGLPFGYGVGSITFGGREVDRRTIQVERGTPTDLTVTLRATATGARVSGRISRVPADVPLDTFSVLMIPEATLGASVGVAPLARDGTYEFTSVPPGRYTLKTMAPQAPAGTTWGAASSTTVTVSENPLAVDFPLFAGAEGRARTLDAAGNPDPGQSAVLTFDNDRGTRVYVAVSQGAARFWLPPGDFYARASQTGGYARITSNGASLFTTPMRSDGVTPLPTVDVIVERNSGR